MTANGQPDNPRSARYVLKDFVNGKLLYCYAPPNMKQEVYHPFPRFSKLCSRVLPPRELRAIKVIYFKDRKCSYLNTIKLQIRQRVFLVNIILLVSNISYKFK